MGSGVFRHSYWISTDSNFPKEGGNTESLLTPCLFVCLSHDRYMLGTRFRFGYTTIGSSKPTIVSRGSALALGLLL